MASAAVLDDTEEKCNGTRLARLLIDGGTETLRCAFDTVHSPANLQASLHAHKVLLTSLRNKRILNNSQWDKLYPPSGGTPDSKTFDITLLFLLLRNICGLTAPATGWDALPPAADISLEANLARVKFYRNEIYGHVTGTGVSKADFEQYWSDISGALIALGTDRIRIDVLKSSAIGETEYLSLLSEWKFNEETLKKLVFEEFRKFENKFEELKETVEGKVEGNLLQSVRQAQLFETLSQCEFTGHVASFAEQHHKGTRLWAMNKIEAFCSDSKGSSKALVITALPGVGKSVLASVICEELQEKGTLGACHFIQHNNSQCNNPRVIIESIARHLCENVDGFKDKLDIRLTSLLPGLRKKLDEMNLETLNAVLLRDPLNSMKNLPVNYFVIVIDALDECDPNMRDEFVKVLLSKWPSMPKWIKLLCTSRPNKQLPTELSHVMVLDIATTDTNNTEDITMFFTNHLGKMFPDESYEHREAVVSNLTARSEGSFLIANFAVDSAKSRGLSFAEMSQIFPKGISSVYEEYLARLQTELGVDEELFMNFLEAVVASRAPLPESLVLQILGLSQTTRQEKRQARKALKSLALLFPVEKKRIYVFHKSLTDWLIEDEDEGHDFIVKLQDGNCVLARQCLKVLREVKYSKNFPPEFSDSEKYSLMFGFHHMLKSGGYKKQLAECVQDRELMSAMTVVRGKKTKDGCVKISWSATDNFCNELESIRKEFSTDPLFQDLEHPLDMMRSKRFYVVTSNFFLEDAANCPASSEIKKKAVGPLSSSKNKDCAWVEKHAMHTLESKLETGERKILFENLSCNEHTVVTCVKAYTSRDSECRYSILKLSLESDQQPASTAVGVGVLDCCYGPRTKIYPNDKHLIVYYQLHKLEKNEAANWPLVLELRDVQTLQLQRNFVLELCSEIDSSCLIRNENLVVGCRDGSVHVLDVDSGKQETPLYKFPDNPNVYCTPYLEGKLMTVGGGLALLWHSLTPTEHVELTSDVTSDAYHPACFSPSGKLVVCVCYGGIKVFCAKTTQLVKLISVDHYPQFCGLTFITNVHLLLQPAFNNPVTIRIDNGLIQELAFFTFAPVRCIGEGECLGASQGTLYKLTFHNLI